MSLSELLKKGGAFTNDDLQKIANVIDDESYNGEIKIIEHIEVIKTAFNRWKTANLNKFQQLQDIEHKDVEMLLDKIHMVQKNFM